MCCKSITCCNFMIGFHEYSINRTEQNGTEKNAWTIFIQELLRLLFYNSCLATSIYIIYIYSIHRLRARKFLLFSVKPTWYNLLLWVCLRSECNTTPWVDSLDLDRRILNLSDDQHIEWMHYDCSQLFNQRPKGIWQCRWSIPQTTVLQNIS
jgi:hypothetical protein